MREAVIVSYARTGLAKSGRGGFNITPPMSLAAHAIKHAVDKAGESCHAKWQKFLLKSAVGNSVVFRCVATGPSPE